MHEREVAGILGLPDTVTHCALVPVAYYTGETFNPVKRLDIRDISFHDRWEHSLLD